MQNVVLIIIWLGVFIKYKRSKKLLIVIDAFLRAIY